MNEIIVTDAISRLRETNYELGEIKAGESNAFNLAFFDFAKIKQVNLISSVAGLFEISIYERAAMKEKDLWSWFNSSDTNKIMERFNEGIEYADRDLQQQFHIKIENKSAADMTFILIIKRI